MLKNVFFVKIVTDLPKITTGLIDVVGLIPDIYLRIKAYFITV